MLRFRWVSTFTSYGNDFDKGWTWHRQAKSTRRRNNVKSRGSARNYQNTRHCRTLVYLSFILFCASGLYVFIWKERNFLKRDARAKYYTRANASNKISLFSSEISNISSPIFVTEYVFICKEEMIFSSRERGR